MAKAKTTEKKSKSKSEKKTAWKNEISVPFLPAGYEKNIGKYVASGMNNPNRDFEFESILKLSQPALKKVLGRKLRNLGYKTTSKDGFLYAKGELPILLVAHMDTVHQSLPEDIVYKDTFITSPQGIGGDDRCGIFMILNIIKELKCHVVFTEDEEVGCVGARKFAMSDISKNLSGKLNYIIEMDRRGNDDAVFYYCGNDDFKEFIQKNSIFKKEFGSYSDICEIAPELDASAVNISCGYFNEHSKSEYVDIAVMKRNIEEIKKLINTPVEERFEWKDDFARSYFDGGLSGIWDGYERCVFEVYFSDYTKYATICADSEAEAIGKFLIEHPNLTYREIDAVSLIDDSGYDDYYGYGWE